MLARRRPRGKLHDGMSLDFATGKYYVKAQGGPANIQPLTSLFTFTGGNQSMYMGPAGLLVASATNTPRVEYGTGGNCLGLLMEAARTNELLHCRDLTQAAWVKTTMTAAKDQTGADGSANGASSLTATAINGTALQTIVRAALSSTFSFDIRRITGTGTIGICQDGVTFTDVTAQITSAGFTRVSLVATQLNPILGFRLGTNGDAIAVDFGQLETGAFASSRIPTTTVSVARTADSCIRTLGSEFSATAGTVVVVGRASGGQDAAAAQGVWSSGAFPDTIFFQRNLGADIARYNAFAASVAQGPVDGTFANLSTFKAAMCYATNDMALSFNGAAIVSDTSFTLPAAPTVMNIGGTAGPAPMNGHILRFDYWPSRLPNTYLVSAST